MITTLIFDADDTLWPCNSAYEQVLTDWLTWVDPHGHRGVPGAALQEDRIQQATVRERIEQ